MDKLQDPMHDKIVQGIKASAATAVERARQTNTKLIVWRDGKIVEISPDDVHLDSPAPKQG